MEYIIKEGKNDMHEMQKETQDRLMAKHSSCNYSWYYRKCITYYNYCMQWLNYSVTSADEASTAEVNGTMESNTFTRS